MEACRQAKADYLMSVLSWLLLGLVSVLLAAGCSAVQARVLCWTSYGIVGAVVGGLIFSFFGATGVTGFNIWSLIVAVICSLLVLYVYHNFIEKRG